MDGSLALDALNLLALSWQMLMHCVNLKFEEVRICLCKLVR